MAGIFYKQVPRKPKTWVDVPHEQHAITLERGIPLRIHAENGGHLITLKYNAKGELVIWHDPLWRPENPVAVPDTVIDLFPWNKKGGC